VQERIRDARDADAPGLIALVGACFAEYPGCVLDVDGEIPELRRIESAFREWGGHFWVVEDEERSEVIGSIGWVPADGRVELRKLYVARRVRRRGLGGRLCALVEEAARARGARSVFLWSDTRFVDAHRLYERRGYGRGPTRELHDRSETVEFCFERSL
jgi:putative acetyltransferase